MKLAPTELIVNQDGSIYHLQLTPDEVADFVLLVGDPGRVERVASFFDVVEVKKHHREFHTQTGWFGNRRLSVISTGIGTDNIDIVINELDALKNIDFNHMESLNENHKSLVLIRLGTSGALQADIHPGDITISKSGLGFDNLMAFYDQSPYQEEQSFLNEFHQFFQSKLNFTPYFFNGDHVLFDFFSRWYSGGITVTCPGFYGPQGRQLRARVRIPDLLPELSNFNYREQRITNFEMETSGIYGLARILGHQALSINVILGNRISGEFSKNPLRDIDLMIQSFFQSLTEFPL